MKISIKNIGIIIFASAGVYLASFIPALAVSVFTSGQVGTGATNGYVLQTNGTNSTWVATSTLGFGAGGTNYFTLTGNNLQNNVGTGLGINVAPNFANLEVQASTSSANPFAVWGSAGVTQPYLTVLANGRAGIGSTTPGARLSIHDNSGGVATSTLEFSVASSSVSNTATTTLFSVNGVGSTTIAGALTVAGGSFRDNNGNISLGVGMPANTKCGILVTNNFAGSCAAQTGAFIGAAIVSDTLYPGYSAASFSRGSNANALNSAGANSTLFVTNSNTQSNDTAGIWAQTQTTNVINTGASFGVTAFDYLQGTGQLTNFVGFVSRGTYATAGPTVTNQYDFRADPFTSLSNGTTTNRYGVYLGYTNASITNAYGIYQLSPTVQNYFAGNTGFGSTSPFARLTVTGGIGSTTDLFVISSSSNTQYLTVKSNGNVGIGTTTPLFPLVVTGTTTASCFSVDNGATCIGSGSGSGTVNSGTTGQIAYYAATSTAVSPTSSIFLSPGGNFGINSVNPLTPLWVHVGSGQNFVARTTGAALQIGSLADDANSYTQTNLEGNPLVLNFNSGANVGVGTTTPDRKLSVAGSFLAATTTLTNLAGTGGAFLAVDKLGNIITTTTPSSGGAGTVTSVALTTPTGLSISGSPITTSGTLALSLTAGYVIPLTASTTNWESAYQNRITSATAPLSISSNTISISQSNTSTNGYLSSTDWSTFNAKQVAGNYLTALTGDATASGPGSATLTLATVNSNVGTFGSATQAPVLTINGKGLVTAASNITITPALSSITGFGTGWATSLGSNIGASSTIFASNGTSGIWVATSTLFGASGGYSPVGTTGQLPYFSGTNTLTATSSLFLSTTGFFGIGSTTPSAQLSVGAGTTTNTYFAIGNPSGPVMTVSTSSQPFVGIGTSTPPWTLTVVGTAGFTTLPAATSGDVPVCINPAGQLILGATATNCTPSSELFKQDISTSTAGIDELMQLRAVSFYFKPTADRNYDMQQNLGLIAQEVDKIDPRLVQHTDGQIAGIRLDNVVSLIISSVQQIIKRDDSQDQKIAALQAEIDALKAGKIMYACTL